MAMVNKLIKSDIIDTLYRKTTHVRFTTRTPQFKIAPYIETITAKHGNDTLEINNKIFSNGNQFRTFTEKRSGKNPVTRKIQLMLDENNNIVKLKNNWQYVETVEGLSTPNFMDVFKDFFS